MSMKGGPIIRLERNTITSNDSQKGDIFRADPVKDSLTFHMVMRPEDGLAVTDSSHVKLCLYSCCTVESERRAENRRKRIELKKRQREEVQREINKKLPLTLIPFYGIYVGGQIKNLEQTVRNIDASIASELEEPRELLTEDGTSAGISLSLSNGWMSSEWVYFPKSGERCCILNRGDGPAADPLQETLCIQMEDIVSFDSGDIFIRFELHGFVPGEPLRESFTVHKQPEEKLTIERFAPDSYALAPGDTPCLTWNVTCSGPVSLRLCCGQTVIENQLSYDSRFVGAAMAENEAQREYTLVAESGELRAEASCTVYLAPPEVLRLEHLEEGGKRLIYWETRRAREIWCQSNLGADRRQLVASGEMEAGKDWRYLRIQCDGFRLKIDNVIYLSHYPKIKSLVQTVTYIKGTLLRVMRLEWDAPGFDDLRFTVIGVGPGNNGYSVERHGKTGSWEMLFSAEGPVYFAIQAYAREGSAEYRFNLLL